jgi:F420-dependent oxidoreductase-like protein
MRFGIFVPQGWRLDLVGVDPADDWSTMLRLAQRFDTNDQWESIWVFDHFHTVPVPTQESTHEAWTLMAAFGAATQRVRLGQMCTCIAYRNPVYLAKVAATVDHVSRGRVEMGIGAGWYEQEWRAYGYGFPGAGERIAMLDEGVQIMRQAWREGEATLDGKHYQVDGAICRPLPVQAGGIPLWIAGGGERKTLRVAAQYADYTNFDGDPQTFSHKSEVLRQHCADVGTDFERIVRSANYNVFIGRDEAEVEERLRWYEAQRAPLVPAERLEGYVRQQRQGLLVGTPEQLVERLTDMRSRGLEYVITNFAGMAHDLSDVELFEREVVPALAGSAS